MADLVIINPDYFDQVTDEVHQEDEFVEGYGKEKKSVDLCLEKCPNNIEFKEKRIA